MSFGLGRFFLSLVRQFPVPTCGRVLNSSREALSNCFVSKTLRFSFEGILFVLIGSLLFGAGLLGLATPETYRAVVRTKVSPPALPGPYFIQTEFEVILSEAVLGKTIEKLHLTEDWVTRGLLQAHAPTREVVELLKRQIDLRIIRNTDLIEMRAQSRGPVQAAKIANTVAETFQTLRRDQNRRLGDKDRQASANSPVSGMIRDGVVDIVDLARVPTKPLWPNRPLCATAGFFGFLLVVLGIVLEVSNRRVVFAPMDSPRERATGESA